MGGPAARVPARAITHAIRGLFRGRLVASLPSRAVMPSPRRSSRSATLLAKRIRPYWRRGSGRLASGAEPGVQLVQRLLGVALMHLADADLAIESQRVRHVRREALQDANLSSGEIIQRFGPINLER
jgi:hypothetical protein